MDIEKQVQIATLKKLIDHQKKIREQRRQEFDVWDKNSAALIAQYERELAEASR